jgi:hypothetical protein
MFKALVVNLMFFAIFEELLDASNWPTLPQRLKEWMPKNKVLLLVESYVSTFFSYGFI